MENCRGACRVSGLGEGRGAHGTTEGAVPQEVRLAVELVRKAPLFSYKGFEKIHQYQPGCMAASEPTQQLHVMSQVLLVWFLTVNCCLLGNHQYQTKQNPLFDIM